MCWFGITYNLGTKDDDELSIRAGPGGEGIGWCANDA